MAASIINVLAEHSYKGDYDFPATSRLVERGGKHYLLHDEWCGSATEGECFRAYVYEVPALLVAAAQDCLEHANDPSDHYRDPETKWTYLVREVIPKLHALGRQSQYKWLDGD